MKDLAAYDPSIVHSLEQIKDMGQEAFEVGAHRTEPTRDTTSNTAD